MSVDRLQRARVRRGARIALLTATGVTFGFALFAVPNIELITATVAIAGLLLGPVPGFIVGVLTYAIFGALNPLGSSVVFPPLWIAQMLGQGLNGLFFGFLRSILTKIPTASKPFVFGVLGVFTTLIYQVCVNLAFPVSSGVGVKAWWSYLVMGIPMTTTQMISNGLIFALLVPVAWSRITKRFSLD